MTTRILTELCSVPTAPFHERSVAEYVERFVAARPGMTLARDQFGNLLVRLRARSEQPRWIFAAHMDHPGFVAGEMVDAKTLSATFHGGVLRELVLGAKVKFFTQSAEVNGQVQAVDSDSERPEYAGSARIRVPRHVEPGSIGMFDVGTAKVVGKRFSSRVCDNLAGAAAALTMIDQLHREPPSAPVAVLLTRAEEVGFVGAIAAVKDQSLLRKSDRLIIIECSAKQPYAPQGQGAIIRVGDRTSVFNSSLSYFLTQQAEVLAKQDKGFAFQRALMPGGTCEATVYDVYGYTAGSICLALGNYHNMDREKKRIAAEYIDVNDWTNMIKLFVQVAQNAHDYKPGHALLRSRLEKRFGRYRSLL